MPSTLAPGRLKELIREEFPSLVELRHDLHAHPELGYEETRTSGIVQRELAAAGVEHRAGLAGGTGVYAVVGADAPGEAVALRADMDALPIRELNDLPYRSTVADRMHACGHDGHTTILVGAARVLARLAAEGNLPHPVSFIFQPAEEGGGGGQRMVRDGCLEGRVLGPPVSHVFGLHGWPELPLGHVGTRPGPLFAASDRFEIRVTGHGGHAAWPEACRDPVVAASAIVQAVQTIVSRNVAPQDAAVISITRFDAGTAFNIIPDEAVLQGTVRSLREPVQTLIRRRLEEIVVRTAEAHGCTGSLDYMVNYPVMENDPGAVEAFRRVASDVVTPERVRGVEHPAMVGEDFAYYGREVPSCFFLLGLRPPTVASMPSLHHPRFDFNDEAIPLGIELLVRLATAAH